MSSLVDFDGFSNQELEAWSSSLYVNTHLELTTIPLVLEPNLSNPSLPRLFQTCFVSTHTWQDGPISRAYFFK